jgi:phage-related protein
MSEPALWTFRGYVTAAGNEVVQQWYDGLQIDERDLIRDRVNYLKDVERYLWRRPGFDKLGDELNEIRRDVEGGTIRLYGYFPAERHHFVILHADYKTQRNDRSGKKIAHDRLKLLKRGIGSTHEFNFEEESDRTDS